MSCIRCAIGLGGNLGDTPATLIQALHALSALDSCQLTAVSALYRSKPIGPADQPDYGNAVATLNTTLTPWQLLDELQALESVAGRVRDRRWGARTLDLDLLLYGDQRIHDARLTVPHPEMRHRAFVLRPLHDVWPDAHWPDALDLVTLLQQPALSQQALEHWTEPRWLLARTQFSTSSRSKP